MKRKLDLEPERDKKRSAETNPHTNMPYSHKYFEILEKRKKLPVWEQREQFVDLLKNNQVVILVGETGSGKTTQVQIFIQSYFHFISFSLPSCYLF